MLFSAWQIPTLKASYSYVLKKQRNQINTMSAIGRTTSCTQNGRAKRYLWQMHTFCSSLRSGTRGNVWQNLGSERGGELPKRHHNNTAVVSHEPPSAKTIQAYGSRLIVRAKVVNNGQHGDRRLAMAEKKKEKAVSLKGTWLPKSMSVTDSTSLAGPTLAKVSVLTRDSLSLYSLGTVGKPWLLEYGKVFKILIYSALGDSVYTSATLGLQNHSGLPPSSFPGSRATVSLFKSTKERPSGDASILWSGRTGS